MFVFSHIFSYYGNSLFPYFRNCKDFCFIQSIWETPNFGIFVFSILFPYYGNSIIPCFGNCIDSCFPKIFKKPINLKCLYFPILFTYYGNPPFSYFGNCIDFYFRQKRVFPCFFLTMGIHFSHILGIVSINASYELCKKPIALEYSCFSIRFPYYEKSFFPYFRNWIGF